MVKIVLALLHKGSNRFENVGVKEYTVMPRISEFLEYSFDGQEGHLYKVVAIHHPITPIDIAANVFATYVGTSLEIIEGYGKQYARDQVSGL